MSEKREIDDADLKEVNGAGEEFEIAKKIEPPINPPTIKPPVAPPGEGVELPDTDDQDNGNQNFGG